MDKSEWLSQVKKGLLEYSILKIIGRNSIYGYDLMSILNERETLSTTEGTIYPLLRRLEKNGLLRSFWKDSAPGTPPRKYYDLTEDGVQTLSMMDMEWIKVVNDIETIKGNEVSR